MKRLLCVLLALLMLCGSAMGESGKDVYAVMQEAILEISGAQELYTVKTDAETSALLEEMQLWGITVADDYVVLETAWESCAAPMLREDPVEVLALALAYKAAFYDFVQEDIIVFVNWSGMELIVVDDDEFGLQAETLQGMGYRHLDKENVLALRRAIADALGLYITDSSFTYYDRFVKKSIDPYVPSKEPCFYCRGTGRCKTCDGDGLYNNPYTGDLMECTCNDGLCPTCDGTGWW